MNRFALLICALAFVSGIVAAEEPIKACVKYQRSDYSWSNGYKASGFLLSGSELNSATNQSKYKSYSKYFVIPWKEGGYTALELPSYTSSLSTYDTNTEDQRGRKWQIKDSWTYCY